MYWVRTGQTVSEMIWILMLVMMFEVGDCSRMKERVRSTELKLHIYSVVTEVDIYLALLDNDLSAAFLRALGTY